MTISYPIKAQRQPTAPQVVGHSGFSPLRLVRAAQLAQRIEKVLAADSYCSAKAVITNQLDEVLILTPSDGDWADLPGGRVHDGEDAVTGLAREVREETGLSIGDIKLAETVAFKDHKGTPRTTLLYRAIALTTDVRLSDEHAAYRWVKPQELAGLKLGFLAEPVRRTLDPATISASESKGHPFRGNQWTKVAANVTFGDDFTDEHSATSERALERMESYIPGTVDFLKGRKAKEEVCRFTGEKRIKGGPLVRNLHLRGPSLDEQHRTGTAGDWGRSVTSSVGRGEGFVQGEDDDVLRHEIGHVIHNNLGKHFLKWREVHAKNKSKHPSNYAKTNEDEGFAESFRFYTSGKADKLPKGIREFFENNVKPYIAESAAEYKADRGEDHQVKAAEATGHYVTEAELLSYRASHHETARRVAERIYQAAVDSWLSKLSANLIKAIFGTLDNDYDGAWSPVFAASLKQWQAVVARAARQSYAATAQTLGHDAGVAYEPDEPALKAFARARGSALERFPLAVRDKVAASVKRGLEGQEDTRALARRLGEAFEEVHQGAARRVAATEAQVVYGVSQSEVLKRAGFKTKRWVTMGDDRVRDSHYLCESQGNVPVDAPFQNGLMFPGDPNGDISEVANCRCNLEAGA